MSARDGGAYTGATVIASSAKAAELPARTVIAAIAMQTRHVVAPCEPI